MKQRIILAVLLLAIICECGWLTMMKYPELQQARIQLEEDAAAIEARSKELAALQEKLDALSAKYETAKTEELSVIQAQMSKLETQKAELLAQIEAMKTGITEAEQNPKEEINDYSYYEEVYNATRKGLEKAKEYLAGN